MKEKFTSEEKIIQENIIPHLRDELGYKLMDFEVPVKIGKLNKIVDIVVYVIKNNKKIPYIVVECNTPNRIKNDDWLNSESYAQWLNARYFVITDGKDYFWYKTGKNQGESQQIDSIPSVEIDKEFEYLIEFENLGNLNRIIQKCIDIIQNEEGINPAESLDELSKLIFAKINDEWKCELEQEARNFKISTNQNGNANEIPEKVAERVIILFNNARNENPNLFGKFKSNDSNKMDINLKDNTIYQIVGIIEPYSFTKTVNDSNGVEIKGTMYETFLQKTFKGSFSQFFTPREIIDFMVDVINPKNNERVLDPASGSGGFLISSMQKVWNDIYNNNLNDMNIIDFEKLKKEYTNNLFGIEINERFAWISKMNMLFHGDGHTGIVQSNALKITPTNKNIVENNYDIILTNPPSGVKIQDSKILSDYRFKDVKKTKLIEVFFLSLSINLLKPGGRLGIILPDGILINPSLKFVRDYIKKETIIKAVISLPEETFMPYGSSTKTSIVFLEKKELNKSEDQGSVFMAIAENIGYDSTGLKNKDDLPLILKEYNKFNMEQ